MENLNIDTKALFAPKKGKTATKGQKQIYEENMSTIKTYMMVAIASFVLRIIMIFAFGSTNWRIFFTIFSAVVQTLGIFGLKYMATAIVINGNVVTDAGIDLNLAGGFADKVKDILITTAGCSFLSTISDYFWILWLWLPGYFTYLLWTNIFAPWFFAEPLAAPEMTEKKRKKLERKQKRTVYH